MEENLMIFSNKTEAEFKETEPRLEFKTLLKYGPLKFVFNFSRFKPALN